MDRKDWVLFIGANNSIQSQGRIKSLEARGHNVLCIDPYSICNGFSRPIIGAFHHKTGYNFSSQSRFTKNLIQIFEQKSFVLAWIECPEVVGSEVLALIRKENIPIVGYICDNPFEGYQRYRFRRFRQCGHLYNYYVSMRDSTCENLCSRYRVKTLREPWSYPSYLESYARLRIEDDSFYPRAGATFIGTNIPGQGRSVFLRELAKKVNAVEIYGNRFPKKLTQFPAEVKGEVSGTAFVDAIQSRVASIIIVNAGNRDESTTRSVEVPAFGGLGLYSLTGEHDRMLGPLSSDLTFKDVDDLATKINGLSLDSDRRTELRLRLGQRIRSLEVGSDYSVSRILDFCLENDRC